MRGTVGVGEIVAGMRRATARHARRFGRFGVVGAAGALVNSGILALLVGCGRWPHLPAAAVATEIAILGNFALNDRWTFRGAARAGAYLGRVARYNTVALGGLGISLAALTALTRGAGLHYLVANLLAIGAATLWNYAINARYTWTVGRRAAERGAT